MPKRARRRLTPRRCTQPRLFIVDEILGHRKKADGEETEYLVRWKGYDHEPPTWEPPGNLVNNVHLQEYQHKHEMVVPLLTGADADVGDREDRDGTADGSPSQFVDPEVVPLLTGADADVGDRGDRGGTADGSPSQIVDPEVVPLLTGADVDVGDRDGTADGSPLQVVGPEVVPLLTDADADVGDRDSTADCSPPQVVDPEVVLLLTGADADVGDRDSTADCSASQVVGPEVVPLLTGADADVGDRDGTADGNPSQVVGPEVVPLLTGADADVGDRDGTADGSPSQVVGPEVVPLLTGADADVGDRGGTADGNPSQVVGPEIQPVLPNHNLEIIQADAVWNAVYKSERVMVACTTSATRSDILDAVKCAVPPREEKDCNGGSWQRTQLVCHMCGFHFRNSRISQHYRRHHKIEDVDSLRAVKDDMRKFSAKIATRKTKLPEILTCDKCGARVRHLQLHLKRNHNIADRAARKTLKEAAFALELDAELMETTDNGDTGGKTEAEDFVCKYLESKSGWRRKPATAERQARMLKSIFGKVTAAIGESRPDVILRMHGDDLEAVIRADLPEHTALVKSNVIALLEFARFMSARQPEHCAEWVSIIGRLEIWKRDASALDLHRVSQLQDKMGEDGYLPTKEELCELRTRTIGELSKATKETPKSRTDAVKVRRLLAVSLLCDNFQRSGAISNATLCEYQHMKGGILRVSEHKSRASYGSLNLVVIDQQEYLDIYVEKFRPLLVKGTDDKLFPSSKVSEDVAAACAMFGLRPFNPTLMRKAMGSAAYSSVSETQRRKIANHMTHRPETAYKAYSAKNRRNDALESVSVMNGLMYGEGTNGETANAGGCREANWEESTIPSSAGALRQSREQFSSEQVAVLEKEVRRLKDAGKFVSMTHVMHIMARFKPMFDCRAPKTVESKLRDMLAKAQLHEHWSPPKRRRTRLRP